jgi:hypothetical protein
MGSLGWVSEFFEVRTHVDRVLTTVDYFDRLLMLIKNLGRHNDDVSFLCNSNKMMMRLRWTMNMGDSGMIYFDLGMW